MDSDVYSAVFWHLIFMITALLVTRQTFFAVIHSASLTGLVPCYLNLFIDRIIIFITYVRVF